MKPLLSILLLGSLMLGGCATIQSTESNAIYNIKKVTYSNGKVVYKPMTPKERGKDMEMRNKMMLDSLERSIERQDQLNEMWDILWDIPKEVSSD